MAVNNPEPSAPPYPAFRASDSTKCFAYDSTVRRWPIILESAIKEVEQTCQKRTDKTSKTPGAAIVKKIKSLKEEIIENQLLRCFNDHEKDTENWNDILNRHFKNATWFNGTWLFNECYMYRRLAECFNDVDDWRQFDPFEMQKIDNFRGSSIAVFELAKNMQEMTLITNPQQCKLVFSEIVQICLWGNATDLSLLTHMTESDIQRLQAVGNDSLERQKKFILVDDTDKLWKKVEHMQDGRVDFVLDNSGFELFVDLIFADWLLQNKKASKIIFHCKTIPWFVSDVMCKDVDLILKSCLDRNFFPTKGNQPIEHFEALETMVNRWMSYINNGELVLQDHDFWCSGYSYWHLKSEAGDLFNDMLLSDLVIFKGDLNFRKLVYDCDWPVTTPFKKAIGDDLANHFTNLVSLRTNKADPIVGLSEEKEKEFASIDPMEWRCSGKYAVIEFSDGPFIEK